MAKLNSAESQPCTNLSERDKMQFKKLIGSGYLLALQKQFDDIQGVIDNSIQFVDARNNEVGRTLFLKLSGLVAIVALLCWGANAAYFQWEIDWWSGITMGILGAYVSIWMRYGRLEFTGLSSKALHYLESISRLLIGAIFAIVVICAVKCGLILSHVDPQMQKFSFAVLGFVAGFSERFVPSMIERVVNQQYETTKDNQDEKKIIDNNQ